MKTRKILLLIITITLFMAAFPTAQVQAAPPKNFFKFPFPTGRIWRMSGGPHPDNGSTGVFSSIDFKPAWHSGCTIPNNGKDYIVAAAGGTVSYDARKPYLLTINHGNGWSSRYMHISNVMVTSGTVKKDQPLGYPSCNGGVANGAHVHFTILYNGVPQSIIGTSFEGWTVQSTSTKYEGCLKNNVTAQKVCRQLYAMSDNDPLKTFRSMRTIVKIQSVYSGKVLSVNLGANPAYPSNYVIQRTWANLANQRWYLIPAEGDYYEIRSVNSMKCMDIQSGYLGNGGKVQEYTCNNTSAQRFLFLPVSGVQQYIQAKHSGKVLDVTNWSTGNIYIQQWQKEPQTNQYWVTSLTK